MSAEQIAWIEVEAKARELVREDPEMTLFEIAERNDIHRILGKAFPRIPALETIVKRFQGKQPPLTKREKRKEKQ